MNIIKVEKVAGVTEKEALLEGAIIPTRMMKEMNPTIVVIILTKEDSLEATLEGEIAIEACLEIRQEEP